MAIYMPVSPLAVAAMLACARIGAIHTVVFAGFSAESLAGRINDGKHGWAWVELRSPQTLGSQTRLIAPISKKLLRQMTGATRAGPWLMNRPRYECEA